LSEYLKTIDFAEMPLDMALRYLLLHLILPKEQGAIYRLLELFAQRYHACNPSLWDNNDQILVLCYSMLMLNTDAWNMNNKSKMTKEQYIKNTMGQGVSEDILSVCLMKCLMKCWYDNITAAPFIDSTHHTYSKLRPRGGIASKATFDIYHPLTENSLEELKIKHSSTGKEFSKMIEPIQRREVDVERVQEMVESARMVMLRGRTKSEGFLKSQGESARLIKVGNMSRRERMSRFGRGGWQWTDTGVILLDSRITFVKDAHFDDIIPMGHEIELDGAIAVHDEELVIRLVTLSGSELLQVSSEDDLDEWLDLINYVAATTTAQSDPPVRRRAGTMTPAGRPVPLRSVSSTLELRARSKSEQPPTDKDVACSNLQKELEAKLPLQRAGVQGLMRQARALLLQTPIQDRTRFLLSMALERLTKRLKESQIELRKSECYVTMLSMVSKNTVRLVESESTDDFQLPVFGFHRKNNPSEMTTDTMLSSRTLYSTLHPEEDIPMKRIGMPTIVASDIAQVMDAIHEGGF